jgi:hypothetical protein
MRQRECRKARADMPRRLLIGLLAIMAAASAHAQVQHIDFQVIHLPRQYGLSNAPYVAIRTQEAWEKLRPESSKNPTATPIPEIDFKKFILLIANTGVKPSSGYSNIFTSVDTGPNKIVTNVHVIEMGPGNCPAMARLADSVSYALIPQTTNEIRFVITKANSNCPPP